LFPAGTELHLGKYAIEMDSGRRGDVRVLSVGLGGALAVVDFKGNAPLD
jgi:hypothetical protein